MYNKIRIRFGFTKKLSCNINKLTNIEYQRGDLQKSLK